MNRNVEKFVFIVINIILSNCLLIFSGLIYLSMILNPFQKSLAVLDDLGICCTIGILIMSIFIVWYIKINIFRILYKAEHKFPYFHNFFDRFLEDKHFRDKVFISAFVLDLFIIIFSTILSCDEFKSIQDLWFIFKQGSFFSKFFNAFLTSFFLTLVMGGGILTSYLMFFQFFGKIKQK